MTSQLRSVGHRESRPVPPPRSDAGLRNRIAVLLLLVATVGVGSLLWEPLMFRRSLQLQPPLQDEIYDPIKLERWIAIDSQRQIPVIDAVGEHLVVAQTTFRNGDTAQASAHLQSAAAILNANISEVSQTGQLALKTAISDLNTLVTDLDQGQPISQKTWDDALLQAYQVDMTYVWQPATLAEQQHLAEQAEAHWQKTYDILHSGNDLIAAGELRRGKAYIELRALRSQDPTDRTALDNNINTLERVAQRIELGITQNNVQFSREIAQVHLALANSYIQATTEAPLDQGRTFLKVALYHLERTADWQFATQPPELITQLQTAQTSVDALDQKSSWTSDDIQHTGSFLKQTRDVLDAFL